MSGIFSKAPAFWWQRGASLRSFLLGPMGHVYGSAAGRRMLEKPRGEIRIPVVCVGNFVLGGAGKTPFSLSLAERLRDEGRSPGFLLRGYGGSQKGPVLVDPSIHGSREVGDEALLLAKAAPTVVSADRVVGGRFAEALQGDDAVDILIMDDGFQNPALRKDLSLVLVDAQTGLGNGRCFPAGPLRAPLDKQIVKADALVIVGEGPGSEDVVHHAGRKGLPIFHAKLAAKPVPGLKAKQLFAFAGIGRPEKMFQSLKEAGMSVERTKAYPDHYAFSEHDAQWLLTEAEEHDLQLVTTSKDMARIAGADGEIFRWLASRTQVWPVVMEIADEDRLWGMIKEMVRLRAFR